jgi:outer membrane murein-binding lipoprotein Lpp
MCAMKSFAVLLAVLLLAGCASPVKQRPAGARPLPQADTEKRFTDAIVAPLSDLNLVRAPIPPVLAAARKAPYATPTDLSCAALGAEVEALDEVLGADLDTVTATDTQSLIDRGADAATDAVIGAVRNTTEGVIPFRGWVRKLTGAERHAREVAAAIAAGTIRRAFLKGLGRSAGCAAPASPLTDEAPLIADD